MCPKCYVKNKKDGLSKTTTSKSEEIIELKPINPRSIKQDQAELFQAMQQLPVFPPFKPVQEEFPAFQLKTNLNVEDPKTPDFGQLSDQLISLR